MKNLKVTVMGLGLHGGGLESVLFFARRGARVTVTDLKSEATLQPSLVKLQAFPLKYTLGRHDVQDFIQADLVIKNPGVPAHSRYLELARQHGVAVESDLSVFLSLISNPLIAVTGSKGKSTTASAIHFCLQQVYPRTRLGGNITVSPLSFLDNLQGDEPLVLELSSWQLADLKDKQLLKPRVSLITNILPDHQNAYNGMDDYIADKKIIFQGQTAGEWAVFNFDDPLLRAAAGECRANQAFFSAETLPADLPGGWLDEQGGYYRDGGRLITLFDRPLHVPGQHSRLNLLAAGLVLKLFGLDPAVIRRWLPEFRGIEHRLEHFLQAEGMDFYNDTAATIPQATVEALKSLRPPIFLITGGTDKNIDFSPLAEVAGIAEKIYLLAGTGTAKLAPLLTMGGIRSSGPYSELSAAVRAAVQDARGRGGSVLFSPGCASFGMFENEFDRGGKFKAAVKQLLGIG